MNSNKLLLSLFLIGAFFAINSSAQAINVDRLPKYVVVSILEGDFPDDFRVDIRVKKSTKNGDELELLETLLEKTNSSIELLNKMDDLGFDFVDAIEGRSRDHSNLIFRKSK